jgi:hypothetical protein
MREASSASCLPARSATSRSGTSERTSRNVCTSAPRAESGELAGYLEAPRVLAGKRIACGGEAHRVPERGVLAGPERDPQGASQRSPFTRGLQRPGEGCQVVVTEAREDAARGLAEQGRPGEGDKVSGGPRVGEAGEGEGGECGLQQGLPNAAAPRAGERLSDGHDGEHADLVGDAPVQVPGPHPGRRSAVDQGEGGRDARGDEALGDRCSASLLHLVREMPPEWYLMCPWSGSPEGVYKPRQAAPRG